MGGVLMLKKLRITNRIQVAICGMPLVAILGASLLPLSKTANQFLMLITLLWLQAFVIFECYFVEH